MRFFNTAGPIRRDRHYHVPPLERLDADDVRLLIRQWTYFVLHAPRQTGKTSALLELRDQLNAAGDVRCVYVNVEVGQTAREDVAAGMRAILSTLASAARHALDDGWLAATWPGILDRSGPHDALRETLSRWAESNPKPLVLLIDEIDALVGDTLLAVLRQLRAGYPERPRLFPQSVVLCGVRDVRDVRDYRIRSGAENPIVAGGSAFNVRAESLRLGDFSLADVDSLLGQHTAETGQPFTAEARDAIWELTQGQPWLVNALAYEACFRDNAGRDRSRPITAAAVQDAREQLIGRRETHLDQLADKLQEERVRRVVEPLLSGAANIEAVPADDIVYVRDLGLVRSDAPMAIANPIYREVIRRVYRRGESVGGADQPATGRQACETVSGAAGSADPVEVRTGRGGLMYKYEIILYWSNEDDAFVAEVPELSGCMAHGRTQETALREVNEAIRLWIETAREGGDPVPEPKGERLMLA